MILLDSRVWISYFLEDSAGSEDALKRLDMEGGFISTFVLMEVKSILQKKMGPRVASTMISIIKSFPDLVIVLVNEDIAERAAGIKNKYYSKKNPFSYGDAVMIATAEMTDSPVLYTGDRDFEPVSEVPVKML